MSISGPIGMEVRASCGGRGIDAVPRPITGIFFPEFSITSGIFFASISSFGSADTC